jgi:hypothetical protein
MVSVRSGFWTARGAALLCLLALGCEGGQTGQPSDCVGRDVAKPVSANEPLFDGLAPIDLARAFEGTHVAPLAWFEGDPNDPETEPVLEDELSIRLRYDGGPGRVGCVGPLAVDVTAQVTTRDSGVDETGTVLLIGTLDDASFELSGSSVQVLSTLLRLNDRVQPVGSLHALAGGLPGTQAWFPRGMNCLEMLELDSESLQPTAQQTVDWLNGLLPESIAWQPKDYGTGSGPETIRPVTIELTAGPRLVCNTVESAAVQVSATVTAQGGETFDADGWITLAHGRGDAQVHGVSLRLAPPDALDSRWLLPDAPACSFPDVEFQLDAEASMGSEPFALTNAELRGGCATKE